MTPAEEMTRKGGRSRADLLDGLFDSPVCYAASGLDFGLSDIRPEERPLAAKAVASRQREFSTGRVLARRLLADQSVPDLPLLRTEDRVPIWPEGWVGSISHCDSLAAVAIAPAGTLRGVGLDVEPDEPVSSGVERVVCRGQEFAWLDRASEDLSGSAAVQNELRFAEARSRRVKLIFSIKEATYKAFYPEIRTFWSFQDVEVEVDIEAGRFLAALPESADVAEIEGRFARRRGWILSAVSRLR